MSESNKKQEIVKFLKESVDLHGGIMAAVENLIQIMSGPLFFELFTFVAFLAINVFIIDRVSLKILRFAEKLINFLLLLGYTRSKSIRI